MAGVAVVMMTGGPLDEARMRELGCAAVIYKPLPDRLPEFLLSILQGAAPASRPGGAAVATSGPGRPPPVA